MADCNAKPEATYIEDVIYARISCSPEETEELNLRNNDITKLNGLAKVNLKNLKVLNMSQNKLESLEGFPSYPFLRRLELCDNKLSTGLSNLDGCKKLYYLDLSHNNFTDISELEPLKHLGDLHSLVLKGCKVVEVSENRKKIFDLVPSITFLDHVDTDGKAEVEEESEESESDAESEEGPGLSFLQNDIIDDDSEEYDPESEVEDSDISDDMSDDSESATKRKLEEEDGGDIHCNKKKILNNGDVVPINNDESSVISKDNAPTLKGNTDGEVIEKGAMN